MCVLVNGEDFQRSDGQEIFMEVCRGGREEEEGWTGLEKEEGEQDRQPKE